MGCDRLERTQISLRRGASGAENSDASPCVTGVGHAAGQDAEQAKTGRFQRYAGAVICRTDKDCPERMGGEGAGGGVDAPECATRLLNHRFNDKCHGICYYKSIDREHGVPDEEVRQRTDFVNAGFPAGYRRIQQRCQRDNRKSNQASARSCDTHCSSTLNRSERGAVASEEADREVAYTAI